MKSYSSLNKATYDVIAQDYQDAHTEKVEWENELRQFLAYIAKDESNILDLGCGPGTDAIWLAQHSNKGNVYAIDLSEGMISLAQDTSSNVTFIAGNMLHYVPPVKIDGIWARASLHHLTKEEIDEQFKIISTYLKQYGIICMINKYGINEETEEKHKYGQVVKRYFQYFDEAFVTKLANKYQLDILKQYIIENDHKWLVSFLKKI